MMKSRLLWFVGIGAVLRMGTAVDPVAAQLVSQAAISDATYEVVSKGILAHRPAAEFTWLEEFFVFDTLGTRYDSLWQRLLSAGGLDSSLVSGARPKLWTIDKVGQTDSAKIFVNDSLGGWLQVNTAGAANAGLDMQYSQAPFRVTPGLPLWFETRFRIQNVKQTKLFVGLSLTMAAPADTVRGFGIALHPATAGTVADSFLRAIVRKSGTSQDTGKVHKLNNDTTIWYGVHYDGAHTFQHFLATGDTSTARLLRTDTSTANQPTVTDALRPTIAFRNKSLSVTSQIPIVRIDYVYVREQRTRVPLRVPRTTP